MLGGVWLELSGELRRSQQRILLGDRGIFFDFRNALIENNGKWKTDPFDVSTNVPDSGSPEALAGGDSDE